MKLELLGILITCATMAGSILIYIGRSLQSLKQIDANQQVLFDRTEKYGSDIADIDKRLTKVETRQEDCEHCP